jgi:hypothetical protein
MIVMPGGAGLRVASAEGPLHARLVSLGCGRISTEEVPGRYHADRPGVVVHKQVPHVVLHHEYSGGVHGCFWRACHHAPTVEVGGSCRVELISGSNG